MYIRSALERKWHQLNTKYTSRISRVETDLWLLDQHLSVSITDSISEDVVSLFSLCAPYDGRSRSKETRYVMAPRKHEDVRSHSFRTRRGEVRRGERCT